MSQVNYDFNIVDMFQQNYELYQLCSRKIIQHQLPSSDTYFVETSEKYIDTHYN